MGGGQNSLTSKPGKALRVGMVGLGYFGQIQFRAWQRLAGVSLVALADPSPEAHQKLAGETEISVFADLTSLLRDAEIDVLDIATPPSTHGKLIREALRKVDTIICQKPFCNSLEEAEEMVELAEATQTRLIIHENFRFMPWYRVIRDLIGSGAVGEVRQAHFRMRPGDGGGPQAYLARQPYFREMERFLVHETGIHWIDVFRFLFGEPQSVYADLWKANPVIRGEDAGLLLFDFENGLRAVLDANRTLDHAADNSRLTMGEFLVEGREGTISLNGFGEIRLRRSGAIDWEMIPYVFDDTDFGGDCVYHFQKHVVDCLLGAGQVETEARFWLANMRIEEASYQSAQKGARVKLA